MQNLNKLISSLVAVLATFLSDLEHKARLQDLVIGTTRCVEKCKKFVRNVSVTVLVQKHALAVCESVDKVNVHKVKSSIDNLSSDIEKIQNDVFLLEAQVNKEIESSRRKRKQLKEEKETKQTELAKTREEIDLIPSQISNLEIECYNLEDASCELSKRASQLKNETEKHALISYFAGTISAVVGTLLIPVSGTFLDRVLIEHINYFPS